MSKQTKTEASKMTILRYIYWLLVERRMVRVSADLLNPIPTPGLRS